MFTYVKLKNFLSFGNAEFNFKQTAKRAKQFVAIYGENGSGKSNFVKSIDFLYHTLTSFDEAKKSESFSELMDAEERSALTEVLERILRDSDPEAYMAACRMVDCEEPTDLEFGFLLNGHEGIYRITFSKKITSESLYYFTGKQRGYIFNISSDEQENISYKFWSGLFLDNKAEEEVDDELRKFWGKHTFLSIIVQQIKERNDNYIQSTISKYLLAVIDMLMDTTVISKTSNKINKGVINGKPRNVLQNLQSGKISKKKLPLLDRSERILRDFFTQTYADIKDVVYEKEETPAGAIRYQLCVDKMIAGRIRRINFKNESAGTQQILEIVRMLLGLFCGVTVVYDEIDDGIHDVLLCNIIRSLQSEINGQLIITTHNTMLLEEIEPKSAYVICVDYMGNKDIRCIADYSIQSSNNARIKYLKGLFGGTPYIDGIDYDTIVYEIEGDEEES